MFWVTGLLGLALIAAPFVLGYSSDTNALWASVIIGAVIAVASAVKAFLKDAAKWEYVVVGLAGLVAIVTPFVLGFNTIVVAMYTTVVVGVIAVVLSGYEVFVSGPEAI